MELIDKIRVTRKGGVISLAIGAPIGLIAIVLPLALLLYDFLNDGLLSAAVFIVYRYGIAALILSFPIALWFAGKRVVADLLDRKKILLVSFRYSLFVNAIIWPALILVSIISNEIIIPRNDFYVYASLPVLFFFIISLIFTPFTIGLLITYTISRFLKRSLNSSK